MLRIRQVEPVGRVIRIGIQFEIYGIQNVEVRLEYVLACWTQEHRVFGMRIHHFQIQRVHFIQQNRSNETPWLGELPLP